MTSLRIDEGHADASHADAGHADGGHAYAVRLLAVIAAPDAPAKDALLAQLAPPEDGATWPLPALPPRPGRSACFRETATPVRRKRGLDDAHARLRFLHAIHHIELSAIDLAVVACLRGSGMPAAFHRDFLALAREEAVHAALLDALLSARGFPPGSDPVLHRLWDACLACADLGEHLAAVPRVLEARGLDVGAAILPRLLACDAEAHAVLARIHRDEIGHVATGTRWHAAWCHARNVDPSAHFLATAHRLFRGQLPGPFPADTQSRLAAGFTAHELAVLSARS